MSDQRDSLFSDSFITKNLVMVRVAKSVDFHRKVARGLFSLEVKG